MASTICMATAPVVGSSFELFSVSRIVLFQSHIIVLLSVIVKGYLGYFMKPFQLFEATAVTWIFQPYFSPISALLQPCGHEATQPFPAIWNCPAYQLFEAIAVT